MRFTVDRLDHLVLHCRDADISAAWYQRVLGMEIEEYGRKSRIAVRFGGQKINLRQVDRLFPLPGAAQPGNADLCLVTAVGPEHVIAHLHECGVAVEGGPDPRLGALGPFTSIYCRDPDGNRIEIGCYLGSS